MNKLDKAVKVIAMILILMPGITYAQSNEDLGKKTFEFLKKYNQYDEDFYQEFILTGEEYFEALNIEKELSEEHENKWYAEMKFIYENTRQEGINQGIEWSKIKYKNYTSEIKEDYGAKIEKGEIYFSYKKKTYHIETVYLFTKNGARMVELDDLREGGN